MSANTPSKRPGRISVNSTRCSQLVAATVAAPGRRVRTTMPSRCTCAPSTECGSECWPERRRSSSAPPVTARLGPGNGRSRHRHPDPVGSVGELVAQLVQHLLELEQVEEPFLHSFGRREQARSLHRFAVRGEEARPRLVLEPLGRSGALAVERRDEIRERAQHARDIAERDHLPAPIGDAARGFTFEVGDVPVVLEPQHLAEVQVTVRADQVATERRRRELAGDLTQLLRPSDDALSPSRRRGAPRTRRRSAPRSWR